MNINPYIFLIAVFGTYIVLVLLFGYIEPIALGVHFLRIGIVMAVLVIFVPSIKYIFVRPYRSRDFLLLGIILAMLSNELFSVWNEIHRVFGIDNDVFTSPVSGFFSLMVAAAGVMFLRASDVIDENKWILALIIAIIFSGLLVFVAPMFR